MRKFTKGLLMTFIASAVSLGSFAQGETTAKSGSHDGYYRVINAGYYANKGTGVINVSSPTTAQPQTKKVDAITMPGTVLFLLTEQIDPEMVVPKTEGDGMEYVDFTENDELVYHLRSQAVDAAQAVYGNLVQLLYDGFYGSLSALNIVKGWDIDVDEEMAKMFDYMKMYLEPTETEDGQEAWYLKSTTPNTRPLAADLQAKGFEKDTKDLDQVLWNLLFDGVEDFCAKTGNEDLWTQWESFFLYKLSGYTNRIHMGHTYYLIGGRVDTNFNTHTQIHVPGEGKGTEFISFANNNTVDYPVSGYDPEIQVAGDYAKWILEEIVPGTEAEGTNYFAMNAYLQGLDGHYYSTLYVDFPMEIVNNGDNTVRVWGIEKAPVTGSFASADPANSTVGYVVTKEYTDEVPARTPVVVECMSMDYKKNFLNPTGFPVEEDVNKAIQDETDRSFLRGIFFPEDFDGSVDGNDPEDEFIYHIRPLKENGTADTGTPVARKNVRVFNKGTNTLNPLGFFKYTGGTIAANKAFMILTDDQAYFSSIAIIDYETWVNGISEVSTNAVENNTIYDIQGRIVNNPTKGLYIVNGKKMVIK